jgi:hypothetical protein
MLKKHLILIGILISLALFGVSVSLYPGGSMFDKNSVGFLWTQNFISNLFGEKAFNGAPNPSRYWGMAAMFFLSAALAVFFINYAKRIPNRGSSNVIKYLGAGGMIATFLIATPLHDIMATVASTLFLVCLFYITVFIYKTRLHVFKVLCTVCMLIFYYTLYIYGSGDVSTLPIWQKINFGGMILLVLGLEYFTKPEDFGSVEK